MNEKINLPPPSYLLNKGASAVHLTRIWSDNDMSKVDLSQYLNKGLGAVHFVMNINN